MTAAAGALGLVLLAPLASLPLRDLSGNSVALPVQGRVTAVIFLSAVCPISNDYAERIEKLYQQYRDRVQFVFVNANQNESDGDVAQHAREHGFSFKIWRDPASKTTLLFDAQVTPEAFVLDAAGAVRYRGRIDDARNAARVEKRDLAAALDAVLAGKAPPAAEAKAFGCVIKRARKS